MARPAHFPNANSFVPVRRNRFPCEIATLERWRVASPSSLKLAVGSSSNSLPPAGITEMVALKFMT